MTAPNNDLLNIIFTALLTATTTLSAWCLFTLHSLVQSVAAIDEKLRGFEKRLETVETEITDTKQSVVKLQVDVARLQEH